VTSVRKSPATRYADPSTPAKPSRDSAKPTPRP
jgi:hypothetical protein